jgi:hypothetical protein
LATALSNEQLLQLASHGARARLAELRHEMATLLRAFPGVGGAPQQGRKPAAPARRARRRGKLSAEGRRRIAEAQRKRWAMLKEQKAAGADRKRSRMSSAARRAVSLRMKKYWAERRKAE